MPRITLIHWQTLEKVFIAAGFRFARQKGSHRSYVRPGVLRPVVIPTYDEVPAAIIRENLRTAGISREEYFRLLGSVDELGKMYM
jgi:predicted RNA binding protein YcfA (HicA-like mRNA interferase family)